MEKLNFVFLIRDDNCWDQVFSHIANLKKQSEEIGRIAVVAVGTSLLTCLKSTHLEQRKSSISHLSADNVAFYLCTNTISRYGIDENMLLPEINIAREGGLLKAARFESMGYHLVSMG